jgi:hypothetical protein
MLTTSSITNPSLHAGTPACDGTTTFTASPATGVTDYRFSVDGGTPVDKGTTNTFTTKLPQGATHTVTVAMTSTTGCTASPSTMVAVPQQLTAAGATMSGPDCSGSVTLKATVGGGPTGNYTYQWYDNGTPISGGTTNPLTTTLAAGDHPITVKATDGACSTTSTGFNVHVNQPVAVSGSVSSAADCAGNVTLMATASGGTGTFSSYQWSEGMASLGTGNSLTVKLAPGDHTITVTATDNSTPGCSHTSDPFIVHVNQPVSASAAAGTPDCSGQVTLTATPGGGTGTFSSYQWFDGGTPLATGVSPTVTLTPGDHSIKVTVTDSAACTGTSAAIPVHINQPVSTSLDTGSTPDCTGHLTFTASATGGTGTYTYTWKIDGATVTGNTGPTLAYPPAVNCNSHTVTVTAKDSANCTSGNTASRTVTQVVTTTAS